MALENPKINIRIKLAFLWATLIGLYIYGDYFELYVPGKVNDLSNDVAILDSPTKLLAAAMMLASACFMIALSILAKPKISRTLNLFFGGFFTILVLLVGISSISTWYTYYVIYSGLEAIITITIVITAWKWPKIS